MGLQPTQGNEKPLTPFSTFVIPSGGDASFASPESRDLHFPRLPCLGHVLRMFFDRAPRNPLRRDGVEALLFLELVAKTFRSGLRWKRGPLEPALSAAEGPANNAAPKKGLWAWRATLRFLKHAVEQTQSYCSPELE